MNKSMRLFLALKVRAPWPKESFKGKMIQEEFRHITLAFLGQTNEETYLELIKDLKKVKLPPFALFGYFDHFLPLPKSSPRLLSWHATFSYDEKEIYAFAEEMKLFFKERGLLKKEDKAWLPHVSICRKPFDFLSWKKSFKPLPFYATDLCLYEAIGNLKYREVLKRPLLTPFSFANEKEVHIKAKTHEELYLHTLSAMSFIKQEILPQDSKKLILESGEFEHLLNKKMREMIAKGYDFKLTLQD
jgi:2'-5' RNA ligase